MESWAPGPGLTVELPRTCWEPFPRTEEEVPGRLWPAVPWSLQAADSVAPVQVCRLGRCRQSRARPGGPGPELGSQGRSVPHLPRGPGSGARCWTRLWASLRARSVRMGLRLVTLRWEVLPHGQ